MSQASFATTSSATVPDPGIENATPQGDAAHPGLQEMIIEPVDGWAPVDFKELLRYRELLYFLVWRDVKVRYKQTVLGVAWAILVPLFSMAIFTVIFGNFAGLKDTLPEGLRNAYPVYVYAGLLPWLFFSNAVSLGGMSLVNQQQLLTKIYFPRLFVPTATVGGALVDMGLSAVIFSVLMASYGVVPSIQIALVPLMVVLTCVASLGVAYMLSALTVSYRDFRFVIPFMVQAWQFLSPVVYPASIVPERYQLLYAINPMVGPIEGIRAMVFGSAIPWGMIAVSTLSSLLLFGSGLMIFRRIEARFADIA
ncbi:Teichoic acid translocation permease protein TagG [Posidoniimonas polymericola]|uniref:Transport permease protein n=1 Tax=Posidoniimonas polymericola TaxID=2528002 RepID=A0A5C5ZF08_9BACT|nr:ABC transporter permease [Posidoniimonas polymericola]TWT85912.1 Teichoic acid translocation permease protein TagG [Posidoniimonas polymericola]